LIDGLKVEARNIRGRAIRKSSGFEVQLQKENEEMLLAIEAEILERTLLQVGTDGGVSN
jgi:hypothetical protein